MQESPLIQERFYKNGAIIWMENSKAMPYFFILKTGQLKQFLKLKDSEDITIINKGDTFGLIGCFTGHNYLNRLIAVEDSIVLMIKSQDLIPFLSQKHDIFLKITGDYSNRLRRINQKLFELCSQEVYDDLPRHLLDIAEFFKKNNNEKNYFYALSKYVEKGDNPVLKEKVSAVIEELSAKKKLSINYPERQGAHSIYRAGEIIFLEREKGDEFYFIEQGKVKISHIDKENEFVIAILKAGEFFGEMAILNQEERNASATAFEETRLLVLNRNTFLNQLGIEILKNIFSSLAKRMWYSNRRSINLSYKNPVLRLYDCLDFIIESKSGRKRDPGYIFDITFHDLRVMTNTLKVEDIKIREFLNDENIELNYGTIAIVNVAKFYDMLKLNRNRERAM